MSYPSLLRRGPIRQVFAGVGTVALAGLAACSSGSEATGPETPATPANVAPAQLRNAAFIADVNVRAGTVTISAPQARLSPSEQQALAQSLGLPSLSLLSNDVITLNASNFFASAPGAATPGKIRVQFNLTITNKLGGIALVAPTFPVPPAGQNGPILFPYSFNVTTTSGGTGTTGGNDVIVELPSRGEVTASTDWNGNATPDNVIFPASPAAGGTPFNFFNDASCPAVTSPDTPSDCFRYETFPVIAGGATTAAPGRRVGFDIDASVGQFRVRILAAADLLQGTGTGTGTVTGTITSPQRGPLAGVQVALDGVAAPATTDAAGVYTFTAVPVGNRNVTITTTTLPAGCSTIAPLNGQNITLNSGGATVTQNYSITCTPLTGTITGTVARTGAGTQILDGITFTVTPSAAGFAPVSGQVLGGTFSATGVSVGFGAGAGAGSVALSNLPSGCTAGPAAAYTGLTSGGSQTVALSVNCTAAAAATTYVWTSTFGAVSGGSVDLTVSFDPTGFDDPALAGPDAFSGVQAVVGLTGPAAARFTGRSAVPTANFGTAILGGVLPTTAFTAASATIGGFTTSQVVGVIRYTLSGGAAGIATTATTVQEVATPTGGTFNLVFSGAGQTITVNEATVSIP